MTEPSNGATEPREAVDLHQTHSFEWCGSGKRPTSVTCNKAGTVEDVLKQSSQFRKMAEKMKDKELVIVRGGKAITSHFPCILITNERIILKHVKAGKKQNHGGKAPGLRRRTGPSSELITFNILTKGGKSVSKILKNPEISKHVQEITVYAYKGEKVKEALRRDGRILVSILKRNCALFHVSTEVNTEMSNLVDDLDGQTYRIKLLNNVPLPESQLSSSLDDDYIAPNGSTTLESDENQDPQQSAKTKSENDNSAKITTLRQMTNKLGLQFKNSMKGRNTAKSKLSCIQSLFRVEYTNSGQAFKEVKTLMKLMELSSYVCQVRINGHPKGTGFLLFDRFVLTNAHVLEDVCNNSGRQLDLRVTVHFAYNSVDHSEGVQESGAEIMVDDVVGFEYSTDASGHHYDWALLRLSADHKLRDGLLPHFGFLPPSGEICIIGHPGSGVKKMDTCLIIQPKDRIQVIEPYLQFITPNFFKNVSEFVQRTDTLTYGPCFFYGSSGSPVFDKYCRVVAMHSGGYLYRQKDEESSLVDFGYPLSSIIEHITVQMVQNRKFDVLKALLACKYTHNQDMMINVKKLVESRNITAFKDVRNILEVDHNESLKRFFDFICLKEEPVQMDTDNV